MSFALILTPLVPSTGVLCRHHGRAEYGHPHPHDAKVKSTPAPITVVRLVLPPARVMPLREPIIIPDGLIVGKKPIHRPMDRRQHQVVDSIRWSCVRSVSNWHLTLAGFPVSVSFDERRSRANGAVR